MRVSPPFILMASFAILILAGSALLTLPVAAHGQRVSFIDALFTSTSAACVTGLIVVDTGTKFTLFGQIVILCLIQLGGLGIITFSTFFALLMGQKMSLSQRDMIFSSVGKIAKFDTYTIVRRIIIYAAVFELIGASLLLVSWKERFGWGKGIYHSLFHAISAFCNAGFSTFTDNLMSFKGDVITNLVIMLLIIFGGIGFLVLIDIENLIRFRKKITLHSRVVILATITLILGGAILFFIFENFNVMQGMSIREKILVSFFSSVTPRTAGFNTVDYGLLTNAGLFMTIILMFIGGSPGGTAGGVKTTAASVLIMMALSRLKGRTQTEIHRRTVPERVINESVSVVLIAVVLLSASCLILQITELGYTQHWGSRWHFIDLNFEAVSAFGTVGLSTGVTPNLTWAGKIIIILLMYIGRLGPLTIAFVVSRRKDVRSFRYAEESVIVG